MSKVEIVTNNNQKKNKNKNKKNKQQIKEAVKKEAGKLIRKINFNPINHRFKNPNLFDDYHKQQVLEYISSILDPEIAVTSGRLVKQPSVIPIWSTTVSYMNQFTIPTNADGSFYLAWNPNMLASKASLPTSTISITSPAQTYTMNAISHISVKDTNLQTLRYYSGYVPDVGLSKYRLVSAKIVIDYIGPVIQKAGMMFGCATYDPTPIAFCSDPNLPNVGYHLNGTPYVLVNQQSPTGDTYRALNEANIVNGLWAKSVNVQKGSGTISAVSIPTDPSSKTFYPMCTYFGEVPQSSNYNLSTMVPNLPPALGEVIDNSVEGTQICYLFCGKGLPVGDVLNVKAYYNFEIIPSTNAAPFLRNTMTSEFSPKEAEYIEKTISSIPPSNLISSGNSILSSNNNSKIGTSTISKIGRIANGLSRTYTAISGLSKFFKPASKLLGF